MRVGVGLEGGAWRVGVGLEGGAWQGVRACVGGGGGVRWGRQGAEGSLQSPRATPRPAHARTQARTHAHIGVGKLGGVASHEGQPVHERGARHDMGPDLVCVCPTSLVSALPIPHTPLVHPQCNPPAHSQTHLVDPPRRVEVGGLSKAHQLVLAVQTHLRASKRQGLGFSAWQQQRHEQAHAASAAALSAQAGPLTSATYTHTHLAPKLLAVSQARLLHAPPCLVPALSFIAEGLAQLGCRACRGCVSGGMRAGRWGGEIAAPRAQLSRPRALPSSHTPPTHRSPSQGGRCCLQVHAPAG